MELPLTLDAAALDCRRDVHCDTWPPPKDRPAPRLVGIELNPGPCYKCDRGQTAAASAVWTNGCERCREADVPVPGWRPPKRHKKEPTVSAYKATLRVAQSAINPQTHASADASWWR